MNETSVRQTLAYSEELKKDLSKAFELLHKDIINHIDNSNDNDVNGILKYIVSVFDEDNRKNPKFF